MIVSRSLAFIEAFVALQIWPVDLRPAVYFVEWTCVIRGKPLASME